MNSFSQAPVLSVILPTDTFETIEPVLQKVRAQTIARQIELILVGPSSEALADAKMYGPEFAALRLLEVPSISPLGGPRAAGIRAATAPFVFVGETHSYLYPDAAEKLLALAQADRWDAVVPGFENANPKGVLSWSGFLATYGRWNTALPAGEIEEAPLYDTLYRREVLLGLGDRLELMLSGGDDLRRALEARRSCFYLEPTARISHSNIAQPAAWLHEFFLLGLLVGRRRARVWPWWRRLVYIAGAGLIPVVLLGRIWSKIRRLARTQPLPAGSFPFVVLAFAVRAAGEVVGYAGGGSDKDQTTMTNYEVRRIDYAI